LIALGHGENSLFTLSYRVSRVIADENGESGCAVSNQNAFELKTVLADVRDRPRLESIFARYRPEIVFHAAAHKHVPLVEENVEDAITNNVLGTRNLVELARQNGVGRFVLISSDKAVNPVSVMGMTKRLAEMIVQDAAQQSGRSFVSVRFGNVLGSRGSVVPLFQNQIADGGPVTVTHADMERYFMTIPEAVQLVLQASVLGKKGEVFVLDMGEPIKIMDLARDLIELSGYQVGRDIDIAITGLRAGEKLREELFSDDEALAPTEHEKILVRP
jgi:FlaA1/EpsC-like NDP-sugar epimerase